MSLGALVFPTAIPNFMKFFGSFGVGGKGMFESRPNDQFGWGFYYINIDNPRLSIDIPRLPGLSRNVEFLRDEYGFEAYYNFAITPCRVHPGLQQ